MNYAHATSQHSLRNLFALLMAAAVLVFALPSDAGCAITVTFKNEFNQSITVTELESKTLPVGKWATVWTGNRTVPAGDARSVATELKLGCAIEGGTRMLRAKYRRGENTAYETKGPVNTAVDRRFNIRFK